MIRSVLLVLLLTLTFSLRAGIVPLPDKIPAAVADVQDFQVPDRVRLGGMIGERVHGNEADRLREVDTERLLEGYRKRPGRQTWDGEHVGKWLHAATLAWANTGDPVLREKLDATVAKLCSYQLADGYLGIYLDKDRWTSWDVWSHKYNLIGLLTYIRYTGNQAPLETCRRMGDLLCRTFGDGAGQRDIITSGSHAGMASTSVLEPMVLLYRFTGEQRYLDFCRYILRAWEHPNGPKIVSRLLDLKRVDKVGNAKAYEMLSCLNGLLEYYRLTGDKTLLEATRNAWEDIVEHRLYLTGTSSAAEYFRDDHDLPNRGNVGETCVTVTWMQVNLQLLRLTGDARYAEQLERTALNQLFGAQQPDCTAWGYYVEMEGKKPYSKTLDANCCLSSGPRGVALLPTFAAATDADGVVLNLFSATDAQLALHDGLAVGVKVDTVFPLNGRVLIRLQPEKARKFAVKFRLPDWARDATATVDGKAVKLKPGKDGYVAVKRTWRPGHAIELILPLKPRVIVGDHTNAGRAALAYGPFVLAADESLLPEGVSLPSIALGSTDLKKLKVEAARDRLIFRVEALARDPADPLHQTKPVVIQLLPFAEAGGSGSRYRVWLPVFGVPGFNLAALGQESVSRPAREAKGNPSLTDGNPLGPVTTEDGHAAKEDWFAVTLPQVTPLNRVTFYHGRAAKNGGWFDASAGKPQVQIQREAGAQWETVGTLANYPATTATSAAGLAWGNRFELRLASPVKAIAVRVIGRPAGGEKPDEAHASCSELEWYAD